MLKKMWKPGIAIAALGLTVMAHNGAAHAAAPYKAVDGDTFWNLSQRYGIGIQQLVQANPKVDPLNIYAGLPLSIPASASKKAESAAPAVKSEQAFAAEAPKAAEKTVTVNGNAYGYSDVIQAKASAYTASASENGGWGPVDYFGNPLKLGTIAVDPDVIPLGSKLYVTGYDHNGLPAGGMMAVAADMGGAIKGDRIDIFVPQSRQEASSFGFQYVKVYVLAK